MGSLARKLAVSSFAIAAIMVPAGASASRVGTVTPGSPARLSRAANLSSSSLTTSWSAAGCPAIPGGYQTTSSGTENTLTQSFNGDLTGCMRVPALGASTLVVALQTSVNRAVAVSTKPIGSVSRSATDGDFQLSVSSRSVRPGSLITVMLHYRGSPPPLMPGGSMPDLCWDGCQTGIQEQGTVLRRASPTTFQISFRVPNDAWFEGTGAGEAYIHPLTSGNYSIGIECITVSSGCATQPADAQVIVHLSAPPPTWCTNGTTCAALSLSSSFAQVGDVITFHGRAPLESIIGRPWGMNLMVSVATKHQRYPPTKYSTTPKGFLLNTVLSPQRLVVKPSATWADLGKIDTLVSTWSGIDGMQAQTGSSSVAWCQPSAIIVSGGSKPRRISTAGVAEVLRSAHLNGWGGGQNISACSTVMLDPRHPSTVYAGFHVAPDGVAPPLQLAGVYTTDLGASWHMVPAPKGSTYHDFGGFRADGGGVAGLFTASNPYAQDTTRPTSMSDEMTTNGAATWSASTLRCPRVGPCLTFGPYTWGNCAMNGSPQALLVGAPSSGAGASVRWKGTSWVSSVNNCWSQQLVATSSHEAFLLDPSSQYSLLETKDSGRTWTYVSLPRIEGQSIGALGSSNFNSVVLAPNGSLFAAVANQSGSKQQLYLLMPTATRWCLVPKVFATGTSNYWAGPLRVNSKSLMWLQFVNQGTARSAPPERSVALSSLKCS